MRVSWDTGSTKCGLSTRVTTPEERNAALIAEVLNAGELFDDGSDEELREPPIESVEAEGCNNPAETLVVSGGGADGTLLDDEAGEIGPVEVSESFLSRAERRGPLGASSGMDALSVLNSVIPLAWKIPSGSSRGTTAAPRSPPACEDGDPTELRCCGA
jgi:hypothetical protein